ATCSATRRSRRPRRPHRRATPRAHARRLRRAACDDGGDRSTVAARGWRVEPCAAQRGRVPVARVARPRDAGRARRDGSLFLTDVDAARDAGAGVEPARDAATRDERALRVAAFTTGVDTPGSRFRIRQYGAALAQRGVLVREWPSRSGAYPPTSRRARPAWAVRNLAARALDVARARDCDVTFLQREFLSTLVTLEPLTRAPRVLDVDDAIW